MTQVFTMVGWCSAEAHDGLTDCFVYMRDETTLLGALARMPEELAKQFGGKSFDWAFEYPAYGGLCRQLYDASLPAEDVKQRANCILSRLMRENATIH